MLPPPLLSSSSVGCMLLGSLLLAGLVYAQETAQPNVCLRWAHQSTVADSQMSASSPAGGGKTMWIYGGRARTSIGQAEDTWTNALLKLELDQPFSTGNPPLELVYADHDPPSGSSSSGGSVPPKVAMGSLWSSPDGSSLYQFFGQFSDTPPADPDQNSLWRFDIASNGWSTVQTTGINDIHRVAEGASTVVPDVGTNGGPMAFYFGGHLDEWTVPDWNAKRIYLSSMVSYDFANTTWRNISSFATKGDSGSRNTTESSSPPLLRADSTLTYVPNLGTDNKGVLVSIGGGNDNQMMTNSVLDVYDIGSGAFVKQATEGDILPPRVNHCVVRGSAIVNGIEQHSLYVYGGQPSNRSTQILEGSTTDVYILSLPSYTWTYVGSDLTSQPTGRSGHTCELIGDQMAVVGGWIREDVMCEQPGVFIFNTTSLEWATDYQAHTTYSTPLLLANLTGGSGSSNTSYGGSGWSGPNNNYTATVTIGLDAAKPTSTDSRDPALQKSHSGSKLGPILGGVAGGLCLLFLVLFLLNFFAKRQRRQRTRTWAFRALRNRDQDVWHAGDDDDGYDARSFDSGGGNSNFQSIAYNDLHGPNVVSGVPMQPLATSHDGPVRTAMVHRAADSTDSRDSSGMWSGSRQTASDDVETDTDGMQVSGTSHLAPRQTLRVVNPSRSSSRTGERYDG